jgi:hypothetical protein
VYPVRLQLATLAALPRGSAIFEAPLVVCCAGLQSDRVAAMDGIRDTAPCGLRIVPFKETYYTVARGAAGAAESSGGLKHLIYACPPEFDMERGTVPFLHAAGGAARFVRGLSSTGYGGGAVELGVQCSLSFARDFYINVETTPRWGAVQGECS